MGGLPRPEQVESGSWCYTGFCTVSLPVPITTGASLDSYCGPLYAGHQYHPQIKHYLTPIGWCLQEQEVEAGMALYADKGPHVDPHLAEEVSPRPLLYLYLQFFVSLISFFQILFSLGTLE